jgi:zinc protease
LQQESDDEDAEILGAKQRETLVEEGSYVHSVILNDKHTFDYRKPGSVILKNGLELLWFHNDTVDIVECQLDLKSNHFYDTEDKLGLGHIVSRMMLEGTHQHPGQKFSDEIESYGMSFSVSPGHISTTFLKQDVEKGLSFLTEMLTDASFQELSLDKVKGRVAIQLKKFWDTPSTFSVQLARNIIYKDHPYNKMLLGSQETLAAISLHDCVDYYKNMISPQGARIAIVGNLHNYDIKALIEKTLGQWQGASIEKLTYPTLMSVKKQEIESYINRDQIVLVFAGLSIDRLHEDYDKISLFDQIFTGGSLRSMSSRLFKLREQSGLFYTIGGSLLYGASEQPGMILIKTIVSNDRIAEAEKVILQEINEAIDTIAQDELQEAKNAMINSFDSLYDSNEQSASTFLFLKKYNLPFDYFEKRVETLQKITITEVQQAVKKILSSDKLVRVKVGRV